MFMPFRLPKPRSLPELSCHVSVTRDGPAAVAVSALGAAGVDAGSGSSPKTDRLSPENGVRTGCGLGPATRSMSDIKAWASANVTISDPWLPSP